MTKDNIEEKDTLTKPKEGEEVPQAPEEKTEENQTEENTEEPQEDLLKKFQSAEAQKEHFRAKAEKFEKELKELKPEEQPKEEKGVISETNPRDIVRLTKALSGYDDDEINFIYRNAKDTSLDSIIEATKDTWVIDSIETRREKVEKEKKIPESANVQGETGSKDLSPEDIKKDPDAHKKAFEEFMKTGELQEPGI